MHEQEVSGRVPWPAEYPDPDSIASNVSRLQEGRELYVLSISLLLLGKGCMIPKYVFLMSQQNAAIGRDCTADADMCVRPA